MNPCYNCGIPVTQKGALIYCSNRCQQERKQQRMVLEWLLTGEAKVGSRLDHYTKRSILKWQDNKCAICGMPDEWNGKPISFILDHIDGNSENNNRFNLRCVCPNCDSQLDTFKSRNKGKGRHGRKKRYQNGKSY